MPGSQVFISVVFLPGEPQAFANSLSPQPSPMPHFMAQVAETAPMLHALQLASLRMSFYSGVPSVSQYLYLALEGMGGFPS